MSKGKYEKPLPKQFCWFLFVIALLSIVILLFLILKGCNNTPNGNQENDTVSTTTAQKNPNSIAIPGYEMLTLKADSTKQTICLPNPPQNCCYFKITLSLEDGTVLWQSDFVPPGETSAAITLSKPLSKGTYTGAKLTYQCFQMNEDFTPLNGAETKLTLVVK